MAKGKYQEWLTPDGITRLEAWARDGLTDEQLAAKIGITAATLYDWKNKYPEISEAPKRGKEVVDIEVENAHMHMCWIFAMPESCTIRACERKRVWWKAVCSHRTS